jgi:prepilin-type N-terminal cleavage/methylation domain-containing protein
MKSKVSENMPIQQKGYTIVELAIAVTIIGVLIVAGLSGVSSLLVSSKANTQIEESGRALAKLQAILTSTAVSGLTTASANGMGLFPPSRVVNNVVTTAMGGGNEFVRSNAATIDGVVLDVGAGAIYTLTNIPKAVCADIATSLASLSSAAWVYNATPDEANAGNSTHLKVGTASTNIKLPGASVQGAAVGTQCNLANTVSMSFLLRP